MDDQTCPKCTNQLNPPLASGRQVCKSCGWVGKTLSISEPNQKYEPTGQAPAGISLQGTENEPKEIELQEEKVDGDNVSQSIAQKCDTSDNNGLKAETQKTDAVIKNLMGMLMIAIFIIYGVLQQKTNDHSRSDDLVICSDKGPDLPYCR
jgi:hypothetical protein